MIFSAWSLVNTDVCYVDNARFPLAGHTEGGVSIFPGDSEGPVYCVVGAVPGGTQLPVPWKHLVSVGTQGQFFDQGICTGGTGCSHVWLCGENARRDGRGLSRSGRFGRVSRHRPTRTNPSSQQHQVQTMRRGNPIGSHGQTRKVPPAVKSRFDQSITSGT